MPREKDLIRYRLERARGTLEEVEIALKNSKLMLAENRIYYSIFYAVSALAHKYGFTTSKHSPLLGWFNQTFIKSRKLDIEFGKTYSRAYEKRQKADYDDYATFHRDEIENDLKRAREFVQAIQDYLSSKNSLSLDK